MKKIIVSVLGRDRPGIIATVSAVLFQNGCNIEDVSQTILQTEFAGIFIASYPDSLKQGSLLDLLREKLDPMELSVLLQKMKETEFRGGQPSEPFIITTMGPDHPGLVAGVTELLARFDVNISNLKAVFRGGDDPRANTMIYEVDLPVTVDQDLFRETLQERGRELDLDISLQHREIFEAIHTV